MKNKDCNIVQDLLPNYIENLTSDETNKFIQTHIEGCKECEEVLNEMKKDINISSNKQNVKEIKFAKKIKRRLSILKLFIIAIMILIIILCIGVIRKAIIIDKLRNVKNPYENCENYIVTRVTTQDKRELNRMEIIKNKEKGIEIGNYDTYCFLDTMGVEFMASHKDWVDFKNKETVSIFMGINENGEIKKTYEPNSIEIPEEMLEFNKMYMFKEVYSSRKYTLFDLIFNIKIKSTKFDGIDCYIIEEKNKKDYFEQNTGLLRGSESDATSNYIYYEFNCVNDDMIEKPDTTGMELSNNEEEE